MSKSTGLLAKRPGTKFLDFGFKSKFFLKRKKSTIDVKVPKGLGLIIAEKVPDWWNSLIYTALPKY